MGIEWIEVQYKDEYQDEKRPWYRGLRLVIDREIEEERREKIKAFVAWLKKHYFFPLRCNVRICATSFFKADKNREGDVDSVLDFYYGKDKKGKKSAEPVLWVAGLPDRRKYEEDFVIQIYARIAFGLTYYYQWYFLQFEDKKRTDRSLHIEATKWQNYITQTYLDELEGYIE